MVYVTILPLPATWTALTALQAYLQRKVIEHDANCPPGQEVYDWRRFVLLLWASGDFLDLGGSTDPEDATVNEITYPLQKRLPGNFRIEVLDQARLRHIISRRIYHNLHVRDHRLARRAGGATTTAPTTFPTIAAKKTENARNTAFLRRCKLVYAVWEQQGYPGNWTSETAFGAAMLVNPNESVLKVEDRSRRTCWRKVQSMKPP